VQDPQQNIVLTGFMGTGKSTVGRQLALKLDLRFVDTDELIESRHGPISRIFTDQGEAAFRAIEQDVARELGEKTGLVIATGGRMLLDPDSFQSLSQNGRVFCLVARAEEIHRRVTDDQSRIDRPLLQVDDPGERIVELMAERQDVYSRFRQVPTDDLTPDEIADEIARLWNSTEG
jgi:shikimate kinase